MKIIIAMDSFKGSMSSVEATEVVRKVCKKIIPKAKVISFPLADGGEGTIEVIKRLIGGRYKEVIVSDPLGRKIKAKYLKKGKIAFVEMAKASGLILLDENEKNPLWTTTFGTGEIIKDAVFSDCKKIYLCVGGSATNDGGTGALTALGIKFIDRKGRKIYPGKGKDLFEISKVDTSKLSQRIKKCEFVILSDVKNPLYGKRGASYVYAPQKGASKKDVEFLDRGLRNYAKIIKKYTGKDVSKTEGSGAAGGICAGFVSFLNAKIISGIDFILNKGKFEEKIKKADIVITGEGRIDTQTFYGKSLSRIFSFSEKYNIPVVVFAGEVDEKVYKKFNPEKIVIFSILPSIVSKEEAMKKGKSFLKIKSEQIFKVLKWEKVRT